jgi:hypothetical protein
MFGGLGLGELIVIVLVVLLLLGMIFSWRNNGRS